MGLPYVEPSALLQRGQSMSSTSSSFSIKSLQITPTRGVVGFVDDLMGVCNEEGFRAEWKGGNCEVRGVGNQCDGVVSVPMSKSIFRAILARIVVLCNEHAANSVFPYGGSGELSRTADSASVFRAEFRNTSSDQWLQLVKLTSIAPTVGLDSETRKGTDTNAL
jgi:hypothetical protein